MAMRKKYADKIPLLLLIILLVGVGWWGSTQFEYKIEEKDKGFQGEALTNRFLAAEYFLKSMGQAAEKIRLFMPDSHQLQTNDTLLVPSNRISFDRGRSRALMDWVKEGGHLIITAMPVQGDTPEPHDYILNDLGITIKWQAVEDDEEKLPLNLDSVDEDGFWQVDFIDYYTISIAGDFTEDLTAKIAKPATQYEVLWTIENANRTHGLQIKLGQGHLSVLSDLNMFQNYTIDKYDHAAFLYSLSNVQVTSGKPGTFYYSLYEEQASLVQWLWRNAFPMIASLFVVIVISLWMLVPRFGPVINVYQPVRRRFLDHLSASGNYHWRQGNYTYLLNEVRKQLIGQAQLKYPQWTHLSKNDRLTHLSDLSQLQRVAIESALFDSNVEHANDFVNKIKILEKLRKCL
ncbi:hypothetical protein MNBD_GAMMA10-1239 [hydrothermal vent metagenome]|uniref:DUF4350 domain-containing protein n=1 Tax=hydrothermal vent metagenome TaxID=652676 RepID=A0A3B0X0F4_9ZZZZ